VVILATIVPITVIVPETSYEATGNVTVTVGSNGILGISQTLSILDKPPYTWNRTVGFGTRRLTSLNATPRMTTRVSKVHGYEINSTVPIDLPIPGYSSNGVGMATITTSPGIFTVRTTLSTAPRVAQGNDVDIEIRTLVEIETLSEPDFTMDIESVSI
jgi:hypothetical protein